MDGKCHNCDFEGTFEWEWSIWDKATEGMEFSIITDEACPSLFNDDNAWTEVYFCPECLAMQ